MIQNDISTKVSFMGKERTTGKKYSRARKSYYMAPIPEKQVVSTKFGWLGRARALGSSAKVSAVDMRSSNTGTYRPSEENLRILCGTKNDVYFHCSDGVLIHAHKLVLSSMSPYFASVFNESWDKSNPNGIWYTSDTSHVMGIVLAAMYTGSIEKEDLRKNPFEILSLAEKFQLEILIQIVQISLTRSIRISSVKQILLSAEKYKLKRLKKDCFNFIKKNAEDVFADENIMELQSENENLWSEMRTYLLQSY